MRIYISVDLEGIHGVDRYDSHENGNDEYQSWKKYVGQLMYDEVKAVFQALLLKGITAAVVFDSHSGDDTTLCMEQNFYKLTHVRRCRDNNVQFPSFDSSVDGIILWGYHVKAGSKTGKLEHTSSRRVKYIKINGKEVGEAYLHGLYAFNKGVPLVAVSGDSGLEKEVNKDIGNTPFFNSDAGNKMSRKEYLNSIREFILNLRFGEVLKNSQKLDWPTITTLEVCYKSAFANLGRWILRKQFKHSKLNGLSGTTYDQGSFVEQWNLYNGFI